MAEKNKDYLRGFLIPFNFTLDDVYYSTVGSTGTTLTTDKPIADIPTPDRSTGLFLGATGQTVIDNDLQVLTSKAGSAASAEYKVKNNDDSTSVVYGNNPDSLIQSWENLKARSATFEYYKPDIIDDGDAGYIVVYEAKTSTSIRTIRATSVDAQGNETNSIIANLGTKVNFGDEGNPCITKLNDGSYLCIVCIEEDDEIDVNVYRSIDDGASFDLVSKNALTERINVSTSNYSIDRVSCASIHGQTLLIFSARSSSSSHTNVNHLLQYASVDGGGTFKKVTTDTVVDSFAFHSIQAFKTHNQLCISYVAATDEIHFMLFPHAFFQAQSLRDGGKFIKINSGGSTNDFASGSDTDMREGWVTGHTNPNGSIIVYAKEYSDNAVVCFFSYDNRNWFSLLTNSAPVSQPSVFFIDSSDCIENFISASYNGGSILAHNWTTNNHGESIGIMHMGGFTTITTPYRTNAITQPLNPIQRAQPTFTWLPLILPSTSSRLTASGTGTETLESDYVLLEVSPTQTDKLYTRTESIVPAYAKGIFVNAELFVDEDDNENTTTIVRIEAQLSTGAHWKMVCEIFESRFEVFDVATTKTSILAQAIDNSQAIEIIMGIYDGQAAFYWRYKGYDSLRRFNLGFKDYSLNAAATSSVYRNTLIFGIDGSPTNAQVETRLYKMIVIDNYGLQDMTNISDDDLIGKRFSTVEPTFIKNGVGVFAQNGPTYIGDEWNIKATSNVALDNMFYDISPSPRVQWNSQPVTPGDSLPSQRIALELSTNATEYGNDIIALHLSNINFKDGILRYWDGAAWQSLFTFETSSGMKHKYQRVGRTIKQLTPTTLDENYYFHNELKGYFAMLKSGENEQFFNVVSNTEGAFGAASGKLCSVLLDGEPSFNGDVYFIPKSVTVVVNLNGITANRWCLELPSQKTFHSQFRIGSLFLGPLAITGTQYSKGRKISIEGGNIVTTTPDKTRYSKAFSPDQRTVSISWSDGVDISSFYDNEPDPDYFKASSDSGALPVAVYQDAPYLLEGVLRELEGSQKPLVYLPSITTSNDNRVYNRRAQHLLSVIDGEINIESITGEELIGNGQGEVMRVGTINLLEIV
jgi:hypothetical protein